MSFFDDELVTGDTPPNSPRPTHSASKAKSSTTTTTTTTTTTGKQKSAGGGGAATANKRKQSAELAPSAKRSKTTVESRPARASAMTQSQLSELTPDARAMARMQIASEHQYARQWKILLQYVQLGRLGQQYLVNSTIADSAIKLARSEKY